MREINYGIQFTFTSHIYCNNMEVFPSIMGEQNNQLAKNKQKH